MYFDVDAHRDCFKTNPNEAYFWHGQTNGCGGQDNAMDIASQDNGKTLEMCMLDNRAELEKAGVEFEDRPNGRVRISYGANEEEKDKFWSDCSKAFAEQASGDVHVIDGADPRRNGQPEKEYPCIYNTQERPLLEQNQNVNSITHIDPYTRQPTEVESFLLKKEDGVSTAPNGQPAGPSLADIDPPRNPQPPDASIPSGPQNGTDFTQSPTADLTQNTVQGADNLTALPSPTDAQNAAKSVTGGIT